MKRILTAKKAIWIDLDNSPHVPLFAPLIRHYRGRGIEVIITARDHAQTLELLKLNGLDGTVTTLGIHSGGGKLNKIVGTIKRARQLSSFIRRSFPGRKIAVAISHGSRAMVMAGRWLKVPVLTMYDYEYTETGIFNKWSTRVLVPDRIPDEVLDGIRLQRAKRLKYPGIKEELYTRYFQPTPGFRRTLLEANGRKDPVEAILAVLRPPATTANYHSSRSEVLLDDLLLFLLNAHSVFTVIVPRTPEQASEIRAKVEKVPGGQERSLVLDQAVDGLDLAFAADLLISGGGTMNREAALLGIPVYSIFAGRQGALDRQMEAEGLITFIRDARDLSKIGLIRCLHNAVNPLTDRAETFVINEIDRFLNEPDD